MLTSVVEKYSLIIFGCIFYLKTYWHSLDLELCVTEVGLLQVNMNERNFLSLNILNEICFGNCYFSYWVIFGSSTSCSSVAVSTNYNANYTPFSEEVLLWNRFQKSLYSLVYIFLYSVNFTSVYHSIYLYVIGKSRLLNRKPVAYLICNQTPPLKDRPSLMTFREAETLFHEVRSLFRDNWAVELSSLIVLC